MHAHDLQLSKNSNLEAPEAEKFKEPEAEEDKGKYAHGLQISKNSKLEAPEEENYTEVDTQTAEKCKYIEIPAILNYHKASFGRINLN